MSSAGAPKVIVAAAVSLSCYAAYMFSSGSRRRRRRSYADSSIGSTNTELAEDILAEIDEIDISTIELEPHAVKYLQTIEAYLKCFDQLEDTYNDIDPSHVLANYDMREMNLPMQQLSMTGGLVNNIDELYEVAEAILPVFIAKISSLLDQVHGDELQLKLPHGENQLKRKQRASEKANDDYSEMKPGPAESWLRDIVRGSIEFNDAEQLLEFLQLVQTDNSIQIIKSKNHFRHPTLSGYRDWNLKLQISTEDGNMQHICELQLHLATFKEAGIRFGSFDYYEFFRGYFAGESDNFEERMDDLRLICKDGSLNVAFLGNVMKHPLEQDRMIRLANLFEFHVNDSQLAFLVTNAMKKNLEQKDFYMRMGNLFRRQGNLEEAMTIFQTALDLQLNETRPDYLAMVDMYNSMANLLMEQGKVDEAMALFQKALDVQMNAIGPSTLDKAKSYVNMGVALQNQGNFEDALAMHQKALSIRLKECGPGHEETIKTCASMIAVLQDQGKLDKSLAFQYQAALDVFLRALGPDHVNVAHNYAMTNVLNEQGRPSDGTGTVERSARSRRRSLRKPKKSILPLAEILGDSGDPVEGDKADERRDADKKESQQSITPKKRRAKKLMFPGSNLEAISEDSEDSDLEDDPNSESSACQNEAQESSNTLKFPQADHAGKGSPEEAMASHVRLMVPETRDADGASAYMNMAIDREKQGEMEQAMELYQEALDIRQEVLGRDNAETADAYFHMANALRDQGKLEEAMAMYQQALDIRLKVLGPAEHAGIAQVYNNMGGTLCKQNKLDEALDLCQKALYLDLAEDHSSTAVTFHNLAEIFFNQGRLEKAMALCQHAIAIYWRTLGPNHPSFRKAKNLMEVIQNVMNENCVKKRREEGVYHGWANQAN